MYPHYSFYISSVIQPGDLLKDTTESGLQWDDHLMNYIAQQGETRAAYIEQISQHLLSCNISVLIVKIIIDILYIKYQLNKVKTYS